MPKHRVTDDLFVGDVEKALHESFSPVVYPAATVIFRENEPAGHAYVIERGKVQITRRVGASEKVVAVLGPGDLLGEMAPIDNANRSATATTVGETEVIPISRDRLQHAVDGADPILQLLLRVLIDRLRPVQRESAGTAAGLVVPASSLSRRSFEHVRDRAIDRLKLETALRAALDGDEFELYFQPIVRLSDGAIAGFEALIRWHSPERGLVHPLNFIDVAEETGLIVPIGLWVLEQTCRTLDRFQAAFKRAVSDLPPLFLSANVSAAQLRQPGNVDDMVAMIKKSSIDPTRLKIEITEGLLLEDPEIAIRAFEKLRAIGVTLALDDFGTGFSSLSYLHRFPLDTLKIDRSFILSMLRNKDSLAIVRSITGLARELSMDIVSEGIEGPEELATLQGIDCEYGQGNLFSRPVPSVDAIRLLRAPQLWEPAARAVPSV